MEVSEINIIKVNNIATSDELKAPQVYSLDGVTEYSIKKRKGISKVTLLTLTIVASGLGGGLLITNTFLGKNPIINNFENCYEIVNNEVTFSFDLTIATTKLEMDINRGNETLYQYTFKSSGVFVEKVTLEENNDYIVHFFATNFFDYRTELKEYQISFSL